MTTPERGRIEVKHVIIRDFEAACHAVVLSCIDRSQRFVWALSEHQAKTATTETACSRSLKFLLESPRRTAPNDASAGGSIRRTVQPSARDHNASVRRSPMIRRLLARWIPGVVAKEPRIYGPTAHRVRKSQISRGAQEVTRKLQQAGFRAFIVGGAVRDLLLGITPKDFDIAIDATPEQVKPLFRRAFLIGRRFRLVNVLVGAETVEVSTFRTRQTGEDTADEHGRLLSDNVFGSQADDALRRDFTINALYFDPTTEEVWDYVGGMDDVNKRRLRLIGDPVTRYREDPVRMLRAARLTSKLGLTLQRKTSAPIPELASLIENVPPARTFDEMEKLLLSGHAVESIRSLRRHGLHHGVLPLLDVIFEQPLGQRFIELALANTDARVREDKSVTPAFLFATLLWHEVLASWNAAKSSG